MSNWRTVYFKIVLPLLSISVLFFVVVLLVVYSTHNAKTEETGTNDSLSIAQKNFQDSVKAAAEIIKYDIYPKIRYQIDTIKNQKQLSKLMWKYRKADSNMSAYRTFTTLNRKELRFIRVGSSVVVPDTILKDLKAYSVFPQYYPGAANIPKLIMVSNRFMSYACYENGKLIRFAACNPGKEKTPSYPGRYAMNWKDKLHRSSIDSSWVMPFTFNFHSEAGSAFHQFEMPGYPASHSCIRQFIEDAEWLFSWGRGIRKDSTGKLMPMSGTPVVIIDHYNFNKDKGRLWMKVHSNKDSILKLPPDPMAVDEALIPISQIPEVSRGRLRNKERYVFAEDSLRKLGVIREGVKLIVTVDFNKQKRQKAAKLAKEKAIKEQKQLKENQGKHSNSQFLNKPN